MKKTCPLCGVEKDIADFGIRRHRKGGRATECRVCHCKRNLIPRSECNPVFVKKRAIMNKNKTLILSGRKICQRCEKELDISFFNLSSPARAISPITGTSTLIRKHLPRCSSCVAQDHREKIYGVDNTQYQTTLKRQGGGCAICGLPEGKSHKLKRLCVDHCHGSGRTRGLLCHACNTGIGHFNDNPHLLRKASEYLQEHGKVLPRRALGM